MTPEDKSKDEPKRRQFRVVLRGTFAMKSSSSFCTIAVITTFALLGLNWVYWRQELLESLSDLSSDEYTPGDLSKNKVKTVSSRETLFLKKRLKGKKARKVENTTAWPADRKRVNGTKFRDGETATDWMTAKERFSCSFLPPGGLWPAQTQPGDDRIINQLMYQLPDSKGSPPYFKIILIYDGPIPYGPMSESGRSPFSMCPVKTCEITTNKDEYRQSADALIFWYGSRLPKRMKSDGQLWMMYSTECPFYTPQFKPNNLFNLTSTYRADSDLVVPYGKYVYYNSSVRQLSKPLKNYAVNKTKQVAWFVSNCKSQNGRRRYALELQKYISVDIYGSCGNKKCPRSSAVQCFKLLKKEYKFYLAFENSNCKEYITEKLFLNALQYDVLPIVMGARPEDYKSRAPEHSYIHVDDFDSPRALAEYLLLLDKDNEKYNSYFKWKGTGEFIDTHFWCRFCALLHDTKMPSRWYTNVNKWWNGHTCLSRSTHTWRWTLPK